jgi:hypothetical protein
MREGGREGEVHDKVENITKIKGFHANADRFVCNNK